jgi:hypothetical protein
MSSQALQRVPLASLPQDQSSTFCPFLLPKSVAQLSEAELPHEANCLVAFDLAVEVLGHSISFNTMAIVCQPAKLVTTDRQLALAGRFLLAGLAVFERPARDIKCMELPFWHHLAAVGARDTLSHQIMRGWGLAQRSSAQCAPGVI